MDFRTLILIALVLAVAGMVAVLRRFTHMERLAMINKGMHPDDFFQRDNRNNLRLSLMAIGGGMGLFVGDILSESGFNPGAVHAAFFLLYGGVGLFAFYVIEWMRQRKEKRAQKAEAMTIDS